MKKFDDVYVPECGDILLRKVNNMQSYILVLGTDCSGMTFGYPIFFLNNDNNDMDYIKLMCKTSLTYLLSKSIDTRYIQIITGTLPESIVYNKYRGITDKYITSIPSGEIDLWFVKSRMNGVKDLDDYSFSLSKLLQDYRNQERKKIKLDSSLNLFCIRNDNYYALWIGTYEDKNLYIRFSNTTKILIDPDAVVRNRMYTNRIKIIASRQGVRKPCIDLKEETKEIVKQRLENDLQLLFCS